MNKNEKPKIITLFSLHLPIIALVFALAGTGAFFAYKVSKDTSDETVLGSSSKGKSSSSKSEKTTGKPAAAKDNSTKHVEKITGAAKNIKEVAETEIMVQDEELAQEIIETVEEEEEKVEETAEAIDEIESAPKWRTLLFGTDYKNIGILRSSLAHNENTIRKLTKNSETIEEGEGKAQLQEQIQVLNQERERMMSIISENESQFSVFGWLIKFFVPQTPIVEEPGDNIETDETGDTQEQEDIETGDTSDTQEDIGMDETGDTVEQDEPVTDGTGTE